MAMADARCWWWAAVVAASLVAGGSCSAPVSETIGRALDTLEEHLVRSWGEEADRELENGGAVAAAGVSEPPSITARRLMEAMARLEDLVLRSGARKKTGIDSITVTAESDNKTKRKKKKKKNQGQLHVHADQQQETESEGEEKGVLTSERMKEDAAETRTDREGRSGPLAEDGRGRKKKKKKAILKLLLLGAVLKAKIGLLLQLFSAHLQVKFFAIALAGLALNIARFWFDLKKGHQPQKVIYYEHAQHQHHYEHEDDHGWGGYWSRSMNDGHGTPTLKSTPEEFVRAEPSDDTSPYGGWSARTTLRR